MCVDAYFMLGHHKLTLGKIMGKIQVPERFSAENAGKLYDEEHPGGALHIQVSENAGFVPGGPEEVNKAEIAGRTRCWEECLVQQSE